MNEMENMEIKEEVTTEVPSTENYDLIVMDETEESEEGTFGRGMLVGSILTAAVVGTAAIVKKVVLPKLRLRKARKIVESMASEFEDTVMAPDATSDEFCDVEPKVEIKVTSKTK